MKHIKNELGGLRLLVRSHPEQFKITTAPGEKEFTVSLNETAKRFRFGRSSSCGASTDSEEDVVDSASENEPAVVPPDSEAVKVTPLSAETDISPLQLSRFSSVSEQSTGTELSVDPVLSEELCRLITHFIRANGNPAVPSRVLGRMLAIKTSPVCSNFLTYIKGAYGSLRNFISVHPDKFIITKSDDQKEFGVALAFSDSENLATEDDDAVHSQLVELIKNHIKAGETTGMNSRDLGRFLMTKKFAADGTSALFIVKEKYGSVSALLRREPQTFLILKTPWNRVSGEFTVQLTN